VVNVSAIVVARSVAASYAIPYPCNKLEIYCDIDSVPAAAKLLTADELLVAISVNI